jgi:hypothetical protein
MQQNDLFSILRSLSRQELFSFGDYLKSPYFNKSKKKIELFEYLKRFYPLFTDIRVDKKMIFEKLYTGKTYNDSTIRNLFSDLHSEVLDFLTVENFSKDKKNKYRYLLNELISKNLSDEWGDEIEKFSNDSETGVDYNYFLDKHLIAGNKFNYSQLNDKISREIKMTEGLANIDNSSVNLLYHFVSEITSNYLNVLSYSRQFNFELSGNLTNKIISTIDYQKINSMIENDENKFIIDIYLALLKMNSNLNDEGFYFSYKNLFYNHRDKLSKDEIALHYSKLTGYCILKIQSAGTSEKFNKELFDLYKTILENEFYKDNKTNYLLHEDFRNILLHALRVREYSWAADFISNYSTKVNPADTVNMFNYGQAYLNYHLASYGEALKHLQVINPDFIFHKFDVRNLTLMVYFELGYYEEALYLIKTYLEFLRKNRVLNTERKKRYLNFVKFTEKLILHKSGSSKHDLGYIKHRLASHTMTAFKPWLLEKISSLESGLGRAV